MTSRRTATTALACLAAAATLPGAAWAQSAATRRIVVLPFAAGGPIDATARLLPTR
jgi:tripartite-type tricarboxylate transporter receptor subunit TctC